MSNTKRISPVADLYAWRFFVAIRVAVAAKWPLWRLQKADKGR